jgi:hypothetical protein
MRAWYATGLVVALAIAWVAAKVNWWISAPIGAISICIGFLVGVALGALAHMLHLRRGRNLIVGVVLIAIFTVLMQHAWLYVEFRRQWQQAREGSPEVAMFRDEKPWPPEEYFRRELEAGRAGVWCLDGVLIVATAVGAFWMIERRRRAVGLAADAKKF